MREKVIHFYFGVEVGTVWLVVSERIPALQPAIDQALRELGRAR